MQDERLTDQPLGTSALLDGDVGLNLLYEPLYGVESDQAHQLGLRLLQPAPPLGFVVLLARLCPWRRCRRHVHCRHLAGLVEPTEKRKGFRRGELALFEKVEHLLGRVRWPW